MKIVFLDKKTLGDDITLDQFNCYGEVVSYETTTQDQVLQRVQDTQIVVTNKVVIDKNIMDNSNIQLICVAATGMNNIDLEYAKEKNIAVRNVAGPPQYCCRNIFSLRSAGPKSSSGYIGFRSGSLATPL